VKATTVEAGFRYATGSLALDGSVYHMNVRNDIVLTPFGEEEPEGGTIDGFFINIDQTRRVGAELAAAYRFPAGHSVYLNYAFTRATFQSPAEIFSIRSIEEEEGEEEPVINPFPTENEVVAGNRLPLVPDHLIKGGATARIGQYFYVGADARYTGTQYLRGDEANVTSQLDDYIVADARVGVEFDRWEISGVVTNLFQNRYAIFGTFNINQGNPDGPTVERFLSPGAERMFRLIVRTSLGAGERGEDIGDLD
jgi:outer membrane receptor protein involved in Fe transport